VVDLLYDILEERTVHLQGDSLDCMDVEMVRKKWVSKVSDKFEKG